MGIAVATKLVSDIATAVKRQFGDESGAQITDTDIIRWVNEGQLEIARTNRFYKTTATTATVIDQSEYTLPGLNVIGIEAVFYDGKPLENRSFNEVQELLLGQFTPSDTTQEVPTLWYDYGSSVFLYPTPKSIKSLVLYLYLQPTVVSSLPDALSVPDIYYNTLRDYVMQQAFELDDDWTGSRIKAEQVNTSLSQLENDFGSERFYPVITVMAEDA